MSDKKIKPFNVLIACEESQAISGEIRRYAARHHLNLKAYSCDLLPTSADENPMDFTGAKYHLHGDALKMIAYHEEYDYHKNFCTLGTTNEDTLNEVLDKILGRKATQEERNQIDSPWGWDMIIANPPCTYLAVSGARWYHDPKDPNRGYHPRFPSRRIERAESIRLILSIALAPCKYIVIENPVGTLKSNLEQSSEDNIYDAPDYNIGTLPPNVDLSSVDPLYQKKRFTTKVSLKTLQKSSYTHLLTHLWTKKLPAWEELKQLSGRSNCAWLTDPPMMIRKTDLPLFEASSEDRLHFSPYPIIVQPYMFGEEASKKTCLWVKGITKELKPTNVVGKGERITLSSGRSLPKWYSDALTKAKSPEERRTLRSKTFFGIARAIVVQWVVWAAAQENKGGVDIELYRTLEEAYFQDETVKG